MIKKNVKLTPIWQIGIMFPDGKKIVKPKCSLNELFETYFLNLDNLIKTTSDSTELFNKYQETYKSKGIKVAINYIDSYGHKWTGKVAWPKEEKFIKYLESIYGNV